MSCKFDSLSLGTWLIIWNCILVLGQIAILRKKFQPIQLMQIPLSFLFGWFIDLEIKIVSFIPANFYPTRLLLSVVFFYFFIVGTREGTVISALLTGVVVKIFTNKLNRPLNRYSKKFFVETQGCTA